MPHSKHIQIEIVLVSPRNPLNIGAVARAMANFGFSQLTVVSPYEPHWREAKSAVGAETLLQNAQCADSLNEAVANATLVLGTASLDHRDPEQPVVALPDVAPLVQDEIARGGRIALVFGPEKRGLTRDDLALCHRILNIPTDPVQPSMNLGQAVAVCLYELAARFPEPVSFHSQPPEDTPANSTQIDQLAVLVDQAMRAADYSPSIMRAANKHDTHLLLHRLRLNQRDARRILGLFRRILWRLTHGIN